MPETQGFAGLIAGYPEVAVDLFTGPCLNGRYFLLSHLHMDHMQGLDRPELVAALAALPGRRLLLSRQSAALLAGWPRYAAVLPFLCALEVGEPLQLSARLVVTLLPAAHCPGSVMFLLEAGAGGTVLYTGDFRLGRRQLSEMKALHDADGRPKTVDVLYADSTFCVPQRRELPDRSRSADCVTRLVSEWLARGSDHRANIECSARYGYENVFRRLHEATGMPVHVNEHKFGLYERLPDISRYLTNQAQETRVHSCPAGSPCLRADAGGPLRSVQLSTLFFFLNQRVERLEHAVGGERYRVLYSCHASLSQVREMVAYLRPRRLVPFVVPPGGGSLETVAALIGGVGQPRDGPDGEPDCPRPPLLPLGDDGQRGPKRPLLPLPPSGDGGLWEPKSPLLPLLPAGRPAEDVLKRPRLEPQSPGQRQQSPRRAVGRPTPEAADRDSRPAWKCPFDSD